MSSRPRTDSANSSQSSKSLSGITERRTTRGFGGGDLRGATARMSCSGSSSSNRDAFTYVTGNTGDGSTMVDSANAGSRADTGTGVDSGTGEGTVEGTGSYTESEPSSRPALSTGQNHSAHQASITVFSRQ